MIKKYFLIALLTICTLASCENEGGKRNTALLPKASGRAGEIIVVMDSVQWKGLVGEKIRQTFRQEVAGLPREESMFKINQVDPAKFNSVLKTVKNLLFVVTVDQFTPGAKVVKTYFTKSSLDRIKNDDNLFVHTAQDEFARNQQLMYLFGKDEKSLVKNISDNEDRLLAYFNNAENKRLKAGLYKAKESKGFQDMLIKEHDASMRIPFGYKLVVNEPGFVWFRQINDESDKNIFLTYKNYTSENAFSEEKIIELRDSIAGKQLFEDPDDPETFITTETTVPYIPVISKQVNFNNKFAMETRGLWKTNNLSMGGPFMGYTLVDEPIGRLYYLEGFVYSPGKNQREFMREMEVILSTFQTKSEITQ